MLIFFFFFFRVWGGEFLEFFIIQHSNFVPVRKTHIYEKVVTTKSHIGIIRKERRVYKVLDLVVLLLSYVLGLAFMTDSPFVVDSHWLLLNAVNPIVYCVGFVAVSPLCWKFWYWVIGLK